jgi:hypothetical protein
MAPFTWRATVRNSFKKRLTNIGETIGSHFTAQSAMGREPIDITKLSIGISVHK